MHKTKSRQNSVQYTNIIQNYLEPSKQINNVIQTILNVLNTKINKHYDCNMTGSILTKLPKHNTTDTCDGFVEKWNTFAKDV